MRIPRFVSLVLGAALGSLVIVWWMRGRQGPIMSSEEGGVITPAARSDWIRLK